VQPGATVRDYLPRDFDLEGGHLVLLNHRGLTGDEVDSLVPQDGDEILAGDLPKGVGAAILVALGAAATSAELPLGMAILGAAIDFIIAGVISAGLSFGIAALTGPRQIPKMTSDEDGPTRNFDGIQDTVGNGYPIPFVYGCVRMGGHFLSSFERPITGEQVRDGITTLHTLLGLCCGPIKSVSDIQVNGNLAADISDLTYTIRYGDADQAPIPGFDEAIHEAVQQAALTQEDGVWSYVTTSEVDAIEIILRFPAGLFRVSDRGSIRSADVQFYIRWRAIDSTYYEDVYKTVSAITRSPFKSLIKIEGLAHGTYEVEITRLTVDDSERPSGEQLSYVTTSEVFAISEIHNELQSHPGLAMVGFKQVPSEQVNSAVPTTYTSLVEGFDDVRVYSSETVYTEEWSDNPAWCCAHWLTHPVIGLGESWSSIDLPSWLQWAAYCDELVPDGKGGLEKRCTFGHVFDQYESADRILEVFTQGSGVTILRRGTKWYVVLDQEEEMIWVAHEGNSRNAQITYLPIFERANRIRVTFADEENDYQRDSSSLEWADLDQGDLFVDTTRELFGVTRRSQAEREVTRYLLHNKFDDCKIELEAGIDSLRVFPGQIFGYSCLTAGIGIASGRILAVSDDKATLELDTEVTLATGKVYEVVVQHQSNSSISTRRIASPPGKTSSVAVLGVEWTGDLQAGDLYALGEYTATVEKFRCVSATLDENWTRKIVGLRYDPQVYSYDLGAQATLVPTSIPDPRKLPPDVTDLAVFEHQVFEEDGTLTDVIDVDWAAPVSASLDHYEVWYRTNDSIAWNLAGTTRITHFEIKGVESPDVEYDVAVVSVSAYGMKVSPDDSPMVTLTTEGLLTQPPNVTGLSAVVIDGTLVATCAAIDRTILGPGGYYQWRRGTSWSKSILLDNTTSPRLELKSYSRGSTYILVKAFNSVGNSSPVATAFAITLYGQVEENVILTAAEEPTWGGTKVGLQLVSDHLELYEPLTTIVSVPSQPITRRGARFSSFGFPDPVQRVVLEGYYTTDPITVSSGQVVRARADASVDFDPISIGLGTFADATWPFSDPRADIPFSGEEADKVSVTIESRVSVTGTAETDWSAWAEHRDRGELVMKYIQFRLHVQVDSDAYSVEISNFTYSIDLPDKILAGTSTAETATQQTVTYPTDYFVAVKRLLVTLIGGTVGDYFRVVSQDEDGFVYEIRASGGGLTTGTIHYEARGY
jgi:hypothetical protein